MALASRTIASLAVTTTFSRVFWVEPEVEQRVVMLASHHHNVSASSAVTTAWSTTGNELFAPERETAVAAIASLYRNYSFVDKHK